MNTEENTVDYSNLIYIAFYVTKATFILPSLSFTIEWDSIMGINCI